MRSSRFVPFLAFTLVTSPSTFAQQPLPGSPGPPGISLLEAVRSTLQKHPMLRFQQQQVEISRAVKQQRSGDFDMTLEALASQNRANNPLTEADRNLAILEGFSTENLATNLTTVSGGAQRLLRSGLVIGSHIEMNRTTDNSQLVSGANRARLTFDVTVPLMRGKGREVATALETSAQVDVEASLFSLNHTIAELILSAATSYWQYLASLGQLTILTNSEARGKEYVESVQTLVEADKLPRSEINQVQANFASRTAGRISFEQQAAEARNNLGFAMGLGPRELIDLSGLSDPFPEGERLTPPAVSPDSIRSAIEEALKRRADYLSAEKHRESAEVLRKYSKNGLLPRLDLTFTGGYAALQDGRRPDEFLAPLFTGARGPDVILSLNYSFAPAKNLALGRVAEAEATYQQTVFQSADKARAIANSVATSITAVYNSISRLQKTREAVAGYQVALEGERDKLRLGVGSLTDMLTVETRLTDALLDQVNARLAYALALVNFRFASGTLVDPAGTAQSLERELFYSLPPGVAHE